MCQVCVPHPPPYSIVSSSEQGPLNPLLISWSMLTTHQGNLRRGSLYHFLFLFLVLGGLYLWVHTISNIHAYYYWVKSLSWVHLNELLHFIIYVYTHFLYPFQHNMHTTVHTQYIWIMLWPSGLLLAAVPGPWWGIPCLSPGGRHRAWDPHKSPCRGWAYPQDRVVSFWPVTIFVRPFCSLLQGTIINIWYLLQYITISHSWWVAVTPWNASSAIWY